MIQVLISTVANGSMQSRNDTSDRIVIDNRLTYLKQNGISATQTTMLLPKIQKRLDAKDSDFCRYQTVDSKDLRKGIDNEDYFEIDAIVTQDSHHALFLPIADCVATTFYDPTHHVLMLSHLGRHSLEQQGASHSVAYLVRTFATNPAELLVWSTPAPNQEVYPIWKLDGKGMKEAWFEQLFMAGVLAENITDNPADSATNPNYYSYSEYLKGHRPEDGDFAMVAMMTD